MTFEQYEEFKVIRSALAKRGIQQYQAAVTPGIGRREHDPVTNTWLIGAQEYLDGKRDALPPT